jgi:hypothetical protein
MKGSEGRRPRIGSEVGEAVIMVGGHGLSGMIAETGEAWTNMMEVGLI